MKFIENADLDMVAAAVSENAIDCKFDVRIESYSCKMVNVDKKEWKKMKDFNKELQPLSPPEMISIEGRYGTSPGHGRFRHLSQSSISGGDSDFDEPHLVNAITRKVLFDLTTVLNHSYSDYDFSGLPSESFTYFSDFNQVVKDIDSKFSSSLSNHAYLKNLLWTAIDNEIQIKNCSIFSLIPSYEKDPFTENGCIWSFNYFFRNKAMKRILFFSCRAMRGDSDLESSLDDEFDDNDE
uniref:Repressor of RNA polymerase III transcription MAF1 n=1 Tax=Parastrongyloides trichosuri TaxID=131310 RepID=A0A0N5A1N6_PARTI